MTVLDSADIELGSVMGPMPYYVDPEEVVAFGLALDDDDPRYRDGSAVPPTYAVVPASPVVASLPGYPPAVLAATRAIVHGEHDMVVHQPIVPGTWVHSSVERIGVVPSRAGLSIEQVVRTFDDDGVLLVEHHWGAMLIGEARGEVRGVAPPDHAFPDDVREQLVGRATAPTTVDQTFRYAGASGDRSPMHVNDEAARERGFPRKFNQGLCTVGIAARLLVGLLADGDPRRVRRIALRFTAPAYPGDEIEVAAHAMGGGVYAFEAESGESTVLRHGRFELLPA